MRILWIVLKSMIWGPLLEAITRRQGFHRLIISQIDLGGDKAYTEINNPALMDGSSVLVIKESFGNAFVPFLVENFQNVYVIDYRYYDGTVSELVDKYNIENVVFVNNISITSTQGRVQELKNICK